MQICYTIFMDTCICNNPLQCSCLENPRDRGAWWAAISGVTQSWTWLKQLSSSSSQEISLKGWAVSEKNDVASDSRCRTTCLFQASGLLLYFDKSIRSAVLHFQLPLTQIFCLIVALQTEFLLQRFCVYLWLHCNSCLCLGCIPHSSVYFLSF